MGFDYDVFFSYRHRPLDGEITQKVFNAVESYRLPHAIRAKGYEDIRRAFRDTEELPVSRILTDTIDKALHSTNCLIVVCSTDTPSSEWIDREVAVFIELGRADHIYPLLITGDPETSFPPSLKIVPDIQERVMDIRVPGSPVKKMMGRAETELLRVISGIVGCTETELLREHKLRRNKRFAARAAAGAAAFAVVAGFSLGLMQLAQNYRDKAAVQETASMRILNELTYSLPDHLTDVPGAYSRIAGILEQNTDDINAILFLSTDRSGAEAEAAANYEKLANASAVLGMYDKALQAQEEAISRYRVLRNSGEPGGAEMLASACGNRGNILKAAGQYEAAAEAYSEAITIQKQEGENPLLLAQILLNAGSNAISIGEEEHAAKCFDESLLLLTGTEENNEVLLTIGKIDYEYGLLHYRRGEYKEAEAKFRNACKAGEQLLEGGQYSLSNQSDYLKYMNALATVLTDEGQFEQADQEYDLAIEAAEEFAGDTENMQAQRNLAMLLSNRALSFNIRGEYSEADDTYRRAAEIYKGISDKTGAASDRAMTALMFLNVGENLFKLEDYDSSRTFFETGLDVYQSTLDGLGDYDRSQYQAWLSYYRLIHQRDYAGALDAAITGYELQPGNVLVNLNLAYACLYSGYTDDADRILSAIASLGGGQAQTIRGDLAAQEKAGLISAHLPDLLALLPEE